MVRQLKVFAVSFLLTCLFCSPVYAEFGSSDSTALGLIKTYCQTISNQFTMVEGVTSLLRDIRNYTRDDLGTISNQLSSILAALGQTDTSRPDYDNMYLAFDTSYFSSSQTSSDYPYMVHGSSEFCNFMYTRRPLITRLEPGRYALLVNLSVDGAAAGGSVQSAYTTWLYFNFSDPDDVNSSNGLYRYIFYFDIDSSGYYFNQCYIYVPGASSFWASMYLYKLDDGEESLSESLTPTFDQKSSDLDSGIDQLESQEDSVFQSLDTSIGSLDFSGTALGQVVGGFTFIRAVFSAIYGSSPYISVLINLSCMLGVLALFLRIQPRFSRWEREHRD